MLVYSSRFKPIVKELLEEGWSEDYINLYCEYRAKRERTLKRNRSCYSDSTKSKEKLGWKVEYNSLKDIISSAINFHKNVRKT